MKRYKYRMRQMGIQPPQIGKVILLVIMLLLAANFVFGSCSKKDIKDKVVSFLGKTIYASEMPVYSYMNNIDEEAEGGVVSKLLQYIYPVNQYIDQTIAVASFGNQKEKPVIPVNSTGAEAEGTKTTAQEGETTSTVSGEPGSVFSDMSEKMKHVLSNNIVTGTVYPKSSLLDYNFLYSNFYLVTSATSLPESMLKPQQALDADLSITHDAKTPQILIFHTHSQETFADSIPGDTETSIVGVGEYLTQILTQKYGYNVIHDTSVYDYIDGKLDRSEAYTYATEGLEKILAENPSIEVVLDIHRDGVPDTMRLVTEINGKPTAKLMFFNGLSYSKINGDIGYLFNPNRDENLAMSLQMQLLGNAYYPGYLRRLYMEAYRYCLHLRGKSMLVECGAQNNTVEEVMNAMEPLADMLDKLLRGQKAYE